MDEEMLRAFIDVVVVVVEGAGAAIIVVGALWTLVRFVVKGFRHRDASVFTSVRLTLGRFLALGLEFQLAGDILRTAVAPSFEEIGQLAAIAAIRTALNYFLAREIAEEQRRVRAEEEQERAEGARPAGGGVT